MHTPLVTGLNEELHICVHEWDGHGHRRAIWQDEIGILAELLDHTKDIVPSTTIQSSAMVTQLVNDLRMSAHENPQ